MFQVDFSYQQFVSATLYCAVCRDSVTGDYQRSADEAERAVVGAAKSRGWLVADVDGAVVLVCCPDCREKARLSVLAC